jgi:hypothetical protein
LGYAQPHQFRVLWGDFSTGLEQEIVEAFDVEEALTIAHERRPELARPRTALLIGRDA